jgi:hypothetical protein
MTNDESKEMTNDECHVTCVSKTGTSHTLTGFRLATNSGN